MLTLSSGSLEREKPGTQQTKATIQGSYSAEELFLKERGVCSSCLKGLSSNNYFIAIHL